MMAADLSDAPFDTADQVAVLSDVSAFDNAGKITFTQGNASVILSYEATSISGGLTRYDVFLDDPTNALRSYFIGPLSFTGIIQQDAAGPLDSIRVNDDVAAAIYDGNNYDRSLDTFFFQPFSQYTVTPGITDTGDVEGLARALSRSTPVLAPAANSTVCKLRRSSLAAISPSMAMSAATV